jgi:arylsulfatase A-like enzyme
LFNARTVDNYASPEAAGWTGSEFLLDPYTYEYLNASFTRNGGKPKSYEGQYTTDLIRDKSFAFLEDALAGTDPFFLTIAPTAPHSNVHQREGLIHGNFTEKSNVQSPPVPAERHKHLFSDVVVPRTPHFNPDNPHSASWISRLPQQNQTNVDFNDHFYRSRLRALQAVDEIVDELFERLEKAGVLDETYIFFSTDNGYHIGQHRLQPGKQCAFEEDINIPLMVRGPGIPEGHITDLVTSHTDLAPTFLSLAAGEEVAANLAEKHEFDGTAIPLHDLHATETSKVRTEHVNVEMWGVIMSEGLYGFVLYPNHTYKALRVVGEEYSLLYTVWCSGERELYDLMVSAIPFLLQSFLALSISTT